MTSKDANSGSRARLELSPSMPSTIGSELARSCVRLLLLGMILGLAVTSSARRADALTIYDDQVIYGWHTFNGSASPTPSTDSVYTYTNWGRRYVVVVKNGSTHATKVTLSLDGQQWIGESEFTSSTDSLVRTIDITQTTEGQSQSHPLSVKVWQDGSSVSVRIYHVTEPTFPVYGWHTFKRLSTIADETEYFLNSYFAGTPYLLRVINGDPSGSQRATNATLHLNGDQILWASEFGTGIATLTRDVLLIGPQVYNWEWNQWETDIFDVLTVRDESASGDSFKVLIRGTDTTAPSLTVNTSTPTEGLLTEASSVTVSGTSNDDETKVLVMVSDSTTGTANTPVRANGSYSDTFNLSSDRKYTIKIKARNSAGLLADSVYRHVTRDRLKPGMTVTPPDTTVGGTTIAFTVNWADTTHTYVTIDGDTVASGKYGPYTMSAYPLDLGPNRIVFRARDALGHDSTITRLVFRNTAGEGSPPTLSASALSQTEISPFLDQVRFIYANGDPPLQTGPGIDTTKFQAGLAAVVRGKVMARDFGGLPNVIVRVLGHSEFGQTLTRADGQFDLVVNGGQRLVMRFLKAGYLEAQRQVDVPMNDYVVMDSLSLIGRSTKTYVVNTSALQVVVGRFETDLNGDRKLLMLFRPGTVCSVTTAPGVTTPYTNFQVKLKEFTVGGAGDDAMPATLPPSSAFTYCVDMSIVEADSVTALGDPPPLVRFNQPVVTYVREFLGIPVGNRVPSGYYDPGVGKWVATEDGVVIKVLADSLGYAEIDADDTPGEDSATQLASLGFDLAERAQIRNRFSVGDSLWRTRIDHFSTRDLNENEADQAQAQAFKAAAARTPAPFIDDPDNQCGCVIEAENRILGESIPIVGTSFSLNYRSNRQPGDKAMRWIRVPLTGSSPDTGLREVVVHVDVAGRRFKLKRTYNPANPTANDSWLCNLWDGKDAFGRRVQGSTTATVRVGYGFAPRYQMAIRGNGSFGSPSGSHKGADAPVGDRDRTNLFWTTQKVSVGAPSMASAGLGGWTITPHHFYDVNGQGTVYYGDGSARLGNRQSPIIKVWVGNGSSSVGGEPPADGVSLVRDSPTQPSQYEIVPHDMAVGPGDSLYVTDPGANVVIKISADRKYYRIAGTGNPLEGPLPDSKNGADARTVDLQSPAGIAISPDRSVYVAEIVTSQERVYRIAPDGKLWFFAGKPGATYAEDSLAVTIPLNGLRSVAVGPDGSVFAGTQRRIVRVGTNGRARTYAGNGTDTPFSSSGVGLSGRADSLAIEGAEDMVCDADGNLFFTETGLDRVRKVSPDGRMTTVVYSSGLSPSSLAMGPEGALYVGQNNTAAESVYRIETDGSLSLVAGGLNYYGFSFNGQDGQYARAALFPSVNSIALGADGGLYIAESSAYADGNGVHKVTADMPGQSVGEIAYPAKDGREVHYFTAGGRHLRTEDALTGVVRYRFEYDSQKRLVRILDVNGDTTTINRDGSGNPTSIRAPYGQTTTLTLDGTYGQFLATVTNPLSEVHTLTYEPGEPSSEPGGLLETFRNPRNKTWTYTYGSSDGRLEREDDPNEGYQTFEQTQNGLTQTVKRTTAEGPETRYTFMQLLDGTRRRWAQYADGSADTSVDSMSTVPPYGRVVRSVGVSRDIRTWRPARDYRFGWFAPVDSVSTVLLPSGLPDTMLVTRTRLFSNPKHLESVAFNGKRFVSSYDTSQRVFATTSPSGRTVSASLNAQGRLTSHQWGSLTPVTVGYDARGKLTHVAQGWRALAYTYDAAGRVQTVTDTLMRESSFEYDGADRETLVVLPGGRDVHLGYDAGGNLTRIVPPGSMAHIFGYSDVGLYSSYTPPTITGVSDPATRYEYNDDRQMTRIVRPDTVVGIDYDTYGRPWKIHHTQGINELSYTTSPSTGQIRSVTAADGTVVTEDYDGPILNKETWSETITGSVERSFDPWLRDATEKVNGGSEVGFVYDDDGLVVGAGTLFIHRRSTDGHIDSTRAGIVTSSTTYNAMGEPAVLHYSVSGVTLFHQELYRDPLGRIIRIGETFNGQSQTRVFRYDLAGRLDSVAVDSAHIAAYRYDDGNPGNGNRTSVVNANGDTVLTADYDAQDRMLRYGGTSYAYTDGGELRKVKDASSDSTVFVYDPLGNLVRVVTSNGHQIDYLIDGMNRRVGYKVDGILQRGWLYRDGLTPVAELDRGGSLVSRLVYATRGHVPDLLLKGGHGYRVITDYLGSVRAVIDTADGTIAQEITYDAWGERASDSAPGFQPLGFVGGLTDTATRLVRFGARDYDPHVSRWTGKDPVELPFGDVARYSYASCDPVNLIDVDGASFRRPDCDELRETLERLQRMQREDREKLDPQSPRYKRHLKEIAQRENAIKKVEDQIRRFCKDPPGGPRPQPLPVIVALASQVCYQLFTRPPIEDFSQPVSPPVGPPLIGGPNPWPWWPVWVPVP